MRGFISQIVQTFLLCAEKAHRICRSWKTDVWGKLPNLFVLGTCHETMDRPTKPCICYNPPRGGSEALLEDLAAIRSECPALSEVLLPQQVWSDFQNWHRESDPVAHHASVVLLALEGGHLSRVTSALHRYLIAGTSVRSDVRKQYLKDLQERWMLDTDPIERHRKSRIFRARLAELQCAEWLEKRGWTITGLEVLREGPDFEAISSKRLPSAFEVKFIGSQDDDFAMILRSIAGEPAGGWVSPYTAINYLIFRGYEAAKQLSGVYVSRIVVLIVEDLTWFRFRLPLKANWVDWANPKFIGNDPAWSDFLKKQRHRYPGLLSELPIVLQEIDAVWIVRQSHDYCYHIEYDQRIRTA